MTLPISFKTGHWIDNSLIERTSFLHSELCLKRYVQYKLSSITSVCRMERFSEKFWFWKMERHKAQFISKAQLFYACRLLPSVALILAKLCLRSTKQNMTSPSVSYRYLPMKSFFLKNNKTNINLYINSTCPFASLNSKPALFCELRYYLKFRNINTPINTLIHIKFWYHCNEVQLNDNINTYYNI